MGHAVMVRREEEATISTSQHGYSQPREAVTLLPDEASEQRTTSSPSSTLLLPFPPCAPILLLPVALADLMVLVLPYTAVLRRRGRRIVEKASGRVEVDVVVVDAVGSVGSVIAGGDSASSISTTGMGDQGGEGRIQPCADVLAMLRSWSEGKSRKERRGEERMEEEKGAERVRACVPRWRNHVGRETRTT